VHAETLHLCDQIFAPSNYLPVLAFKMGSKLEQGNPAITCSLNLELHESVEKFINQSLRNQN
jgi:hypothetical protein